MSHSHKKTLLVLCYIIFIAIALFNSEFIITWLNKSLFVDYMMNTDGVKDSFYIGSSLILLFTILIYSIMGSFIVSIIITDIFFGAMIIGNNIKVTERNEFVTFSELQTIFTSPKELLSFVDISVASALIVLLLVITGIAAIQWASIWFAKKTNLLLHRRLRWTLFILSFILLVFIYFEPNLYNKYLLKYEVSEGHNFNPLKRAQKDGFLPSFIHTIKPTYMEKPIDYNQLKMIAFFEKYTKLAQDINKNRKKPLSDSQTILYLSESFIDPKSLPELLLNDTPTPFIAEIAKSNAGGTMHSQYIGGGTANIEWSVLTSFSLEVFSDPISVTPYSDFYVDSKNHQTVLSFYNNEKIALHPYTAHLYKRISIYNAIGFDDFLYLDNGIRNTDKLGTFRTVSDESLNKDILNYLGKEDIGLMHVLTMQNHSPYSGEIPNMSYQPQINLNVFPEVDEKGLYNYLQGLNATDQAIEDLINEIDNSNKEINFLFYGDHFPSLFRGADNHFTYQELHETPWFIYMNQGRSQNGTQIDGLSPSFFVTLILQEGDYYVSPFQALMDELLTKGVKRIGSDFIIAEKGMILDDDLSNDLLELVNDYRMIEYDALLGNNWLSDEFYNLIPDF